ncbi:MAG: hypothetical protein P3C10_14680, partial [Gemmatimonadota bacterium]|nr:hypothetical protein [Gemmatimonadota bacterium]
MVARRAARHALVVLGLLACSAPSPERETPGAAAEGRIADVAVTATADRATAATRDGGMLSLARAAGGPDGTEYTVAVPASTGFIVGKVAGGAPRDTSIAPTHDLSVCRPFSESLVPSRD